MITGTYNTYYDWGNTGSYVQMTTTFNSNNTFTDGQGGNGEWYSLGGSIVFIYRNGTIYSGNFCGHAMVGSMKNVTSGTSIGAWYSVIENSTVNTLERKANSLSASGEKR